MLFYRTLQATQFLYFVCVQLALFFVSPGMELDMAEQVWLSRRYAFVYGSQPPLYTWMVRTLLLASGGSLLPLYLFKAALLSLTVGALLSIGRRLGFSGQQLMGIVAAAFWAPIFSWESQRDLTHTVLASAIAALTLRESATGSVSPGVFGALRLGLLLAAGTLSKYNYLLFAIIWGAICLAPRVAGEPTVRRTALAGIALALILILPHLSAATKAEALWLESVEKFELEDATRWKGFVDAAGSLLIVFLPVLGLAAVSGIRGALALRVSSMASDLLQRLARLAFASSIAVLAITVVSGASEVRERWLWPMFFYTPLIAGALLPLAPPAAARRFIAIGFFLALIAGVALPLRVVAADLLGSHNRLNLPYRDLMQAIAQRHAASPAFVIVDGVLLAGAARLSFPHAEIYVYDRPNSAPPPRGAGLIIGRAEQRAREPFEQWLDRMDLAPTSPPQEVSAPLYRSARKTAALWWAPVRADTPVHFDDLEE